MKALKAKPAAKAFFDSLDSQNRYSVLFRIHTAKKVETRTNRIQAVEKTDMRTGLGMYRDRRLAMSIRRRYGVRLGLS
jgi:uncharacterized protein YdeI (YjbR/CyaY-like superfamily)